MKYTPIGLKHQDQLIIVSPIDILYFIALENKTEVFLKNGEKIILHLPIESIEQQISNSSFFRINETVLINVKAINIFIQKASKWFVVMEDQKEIDVAPPRITVFKERFIVA